VQASAPSVSSGGERPMLRILAIALLILGSTRVTVAQNQPDSSADKSMILALESAWNQAEIHHDATAAAAIIADTFISVDHHWRDSEQVPVPGWTQGSFFQARRNCQLRDQRVPLRRCRHCHQCLSNQRHRWWQALHPSRALHRHLDQTERRMEVRRGSGNPDPLI